MSRIEELKAIMAEIEEGLNKIQIREIKLNEDVHMDPFVKNKLIEENEYLKSMFESRVTEVKTLIEIEKRLNL